MSKRTKWAGHVGVPRYADGMTAFGQAEYGDPTRLTCPVSREHDDGYVRVVPEHCGVLPGYDSYATECGFKGDVTVLACVGECGCAWEVWFCFHKGQTYVQARTMRDGDATGYVGDDDLEWALG